MGHGRHTVLVFCCAITDSALDKKGGQSQMAVLLHPPAIVRPSDLSSPQAMLITDLEALPVTLRVEHIAAIYGNKIATVYELIRLGSDKIPMPFLSRPYRFRKTDVIKHYAQSHVALRGRLRRR
jgi:hypothetical protein